MTKIQNAVVLNSKLYSHLFEEGGDELIAVYSILRFYKKGAIKYYNEGKLTSYKLLHAKTKLSLTTLKRYVPELISLGLCAFDRHQQLVLTGTNKINKLYKNKLNKFVPIEISTYTKTKLFSFRVRVKTMEQTQKDAIDKKSHQINIIAKQADKKYLSPKELQQLKNMEKRGIVPVNLNDKVILSIQGYFKLKSGKRSKSNNGQYWKGKLIKADIIKTRRVQDLIKKVTKEEFKTLNNYDRSLFYYKGAIYKERISEFTTTEFITSAPQVVNRETKIKPLDHLAFDMIHWWDS